ncbi:sensor histidine kinase [Megalodesulfovibrio gigas]|uniref:histidine kinase n=1 Tax=Megalodesulfovibrio gigas (strain ATCC 19364 / DSM 1382 / NCIMB 9332 / VKM B-1759) TaxID=1121448 RepID=T2GER1_MEGG1|nr:ATP-binding protein [Megalodesulfovibrio gigas]AGW14654.1 putative PAS domain S-box protein [Megalodesulfovibrio gigas DSM 1382 = ATCC 19364]
MAIDHIFVDNILESMPQGCMVINAAGEVVFVNAAITAVLGFSREELTGGGWGERFFSREENYEFNQILVDVINQEPIHLRRETPYSFPGEDAPRRLAVTSSFLRDQGAVAGIVLLVEDVTELHLRQAREKALFEHVHALQQERSESLRRLALSVAHQVRNPAMTIGGFASLLLRGVRLPEQARQKLDIIREEAVKLERTVKAVAEYASLPQLERQAVSVSELVQAVSEEARCQYCSVTADMQCSVHCLPGPLMVDPVQVRRALRAVYVNALEAAVDGRVRVETDVQPGPQGVAVRIKDDGCGISPKDMPFIFDPFFTTKPGNVGMGLCETRLIMLEHHGEVTVESKPGAGATVTLRFPCTPDGQESPPA